MTEFADLHNLSENDRVRQIGQQVMTGDSCSFVVEDKVKAARYVRKLRKQFPLLGKMETMASPFKGLICVKVNPPCRPENPSTN